MSLQPERGSSSSQELRLPARDGTGGQLLPYAEEACRRLHIPPHQASRVMGRGWNWEPVSKHSVRDDVRDFNQLYDVLAEAQSLALVHSSKVADRSVARAVNDFFVLAQGNLLRDFLAHLSLAERPLEVLQELMRSPNQGVRPAMISAVVGIRDETVGGDSLRHPSQERNTLFWRGGFMYQPSEPFDVSPIFSTLQMRPGSVFYDLGAGYGHALFFGAVVRPDIQFRGIELMPGRVRECEAARRRLGLSNLSFVAGDVTRGGFSQADILFLFNPFPPDVQEEVTRVIDSVAQQKPLVVLDYEGLVTKWSESLVPIPVRDLSPYQVMCSRSFLGESCELAGVSVPATRLKRRKS